MDAIKVANLAIRFLLEICVLISIGYWGFKTGSGWLLKIVLGIGVPLLIVVIWAMFGAPKSSMRLEGLLYLLLEVIVFSSGVAALVLTRNYALVWVFAVVIIINRILLLVWRQ